MLFLIFIQILREPSVLRRLVWFALFANVPQKGRTAYHLCYLGIVFVMLSRLFIAALWLPEGKGLIFWLLFVMFIVILLLSHLGSWNRRGT